jgi:DNA-binding beta-propeller fold protein YncE
MENTSVVKLTITVSHSITIIFVLNFVQYAFRVNINKLLYISDTETVSCYDMNGKHMWSFSDTSLLHQPRGIVVDSDGFVFVTGKKTGNIVVISPDGNSAKEVYQI